MSLERKHNIFNKLVPLLLLFSLLTLTGSFIFFALPSWQMAREKSPIYYRQEPFKPTEKVVKAGQTLHLSGERCNRTSRPVAFTSKRNIVNIDSGERTEIDSINVETVPGCEPFYSAPIRIPVYIPPGNYTVTGYVELTSQRGRLHSVFWRSDRFQVVAPN